MIPHEMIRQFVTIADVIVFIVIISTEIYNFKNKKSPIENMPAYFVMALLSFISIPFIF